MKSRTAAGRAGQIKLRGKKSAVLSCRCCDVFNFKNKVRDKEAHQQIKLFQKYGR